MPRCGNKESTNLRGRTDDGTCEQTSEDSETHNASNEKKIIGLNGFRQYIFERAAFEQSDPQLLMV